MLETQSNFRNEYLSLQILERLAEINYVAEVFDDDCSHSVRPNGNNEWQSLEERWISGVRVKPGSVGTTVRETPSTSPIISWALDTPCKNLTVWEILLHEVLNVALAQDSNISDHSIKQVCAIAEFLWEFSETSNHIPPNIFRLVQPTTDILKL